MKTLIRESQLGILMVTCTDTAILCGNTPEACFNKYGSVPLRHKSCHEIVISLISNRSFEIPNYFYTIWQALRILLRAIDSHANRYGRYIVPLLSVSVDFYIRCFVQIHSGAAMAKDSVMCVRFFSTIFIFKKFPQLITIIQSQEACSRPLMRNLPQSGFPTTCPEIHQWIQHSLLKRPFSKQFVSECNKK